MTYPAVSHQTTALWEDSEVQCPVTAFLNNRNIIICFWGNVKGFRGNNFDDVKKINCCLGGSAAGQYRVAVSVSVMHHPMGCTAVNCCLTGSAR